ncbi:MAG TPA: sigma-70 family RNA polymerase sigma factor [Armatimonadota bacterium]|jgi:RNA polymerase sigma-70 factor (ECF subfamily)
MQMPTDEQLTYRMVEGEREALGLLFDRHHPALYSFLWHLVGDPTAAEDLVQESFARLWHSRRRVDPRRSLRAWLFTLARNAALNHLKRRGRETPFTSLSEGELRRVSEVPDTTLSGSPEAALVSGCLRDVVRQALQVLPEEQRVAVLLREAEGCSYREVGEVLGCSEGNARVITCRARQALRSTLLPRLREEEEPCPSR